jgi:hypothetical protein
MFSNFVTWIGLAIGRRGSTSAASRRISNLQNFSQF